MNYVWYRNVAEGPALDEMATDRRGRIAWPWATTC